MSESSDRWTDIDRLLKRGEPLPEDLTAAEMLYALSVRSIYAQFSTGQIPRDQAVKVKAQLLSAARKYQQNIFSYRAGCKEQQENIRRAGELRAELVKAESKDDVLELALQIISRMVGEEETERIVREKWILQKTKQ